MGVDAEMFIKIKGRDNWLTEQKIISLAYDVGECFGSDRFWIWENGWSTSRAIELVAPHDGKDEHPELTGKVVYLQDGDPIFAEEDEQFVRVYPATRYYGREYERGDLPFLLILAEWLERKIPQGELWYGGDSSGCIAEPFDKEARENLFMHFVKVGHRPYNTFFGEGLPRAICEFCGGIPMMNNGGGQGYLFNTCNGCGNKAIIDRRTGEMKRKLERHGNFFTALEELVEESKAH